MLRALLVLVTVAACGDVQEPPPPLEFERVEIEVDGSPHVLAAELTGDGPPDLAVAAGGHVLILAGDGEGDFRRAGRTAGGENPTGLAAADVNGDGNLDLAASSGEGGEGVAVLLGDGAGRFEHAADFDGDGRSDLAVAVHGEGTIVVLLSREAGRPDGAS